MGAPDHGHEGSDHETDHQRQKGDHDRVLQTLEDVGIAVVVDEVLLESLPESAAALIGRIAGILVVVGRCVRAVVVLGVVRDDLVDRAVVLQLLQGRVERFEELRVLLREDESVVLDVRVEDVQDPQIRVGLDLGLRDHAVDELAVHLPVLDIHHRLDEGFLEADVVDVREILGQRGTGGSGLDGDPRTHDVVDGVERGVLLDDGHLLDGGVGIREIDLQFPLFADGESRGAHVGLALLDREDDRVEVVLLEHHIVSEILADRADDIHVDPRVLRSEQVLVGREVRAGLDGDRPLAGLAVVGRGVGAVVVIHVVLEDLVDRTVVLQLRQRGIERLEQLRVTLGEYESVVLGIRIEDVEDLQIGILLDLRFRDHAVDDLAVHLPVLDIHHRLDEGFLEADVPCIGVVLGQFGAGGSGLDGDPRALDVIRRADGRILQDHRHLSDAGVRIGEVDLLLPLVADCETGGAHVGLALLDGQDDRIEVVLPELDLVAEILADGPDDVHVDARVLRSEQILVGREIGAGLDDDGLRVGGVGRGVGAASVLHIVVYDLLDRAVVDELFQSRVELLIETAVLGEDESVVLGLGIRQDVADLELGVSGYLRLSDHVIDDLSIGLAVEDIQHHIGVRLLVDDVAADRLGVVGTGGAGLDGELLPLDVLQRVDRRILEDHGHLLDGGVRLAEVDLQLPLIVDRESGGAEVTFLLLHGHEDRVEGVLPELDAVSYLFANGTDHVHVDSGELVAVVVIERCEIGTGLNDN